MRFFPGAKAKAFAPASVANVAVGFDLLGFSAGIIGDTATVEVTSQPTVTVGSSDESSGPLAGRPSALKLNLPTDPLLNTATAGLISLIRDKNLEHGFKVTIDKGIPLGSGLGGSAASAVASIFAANSLLENNLTREEMLMYALVGESKASGSKHADNIAPSLCGGLTLATTYGPTGDDVSVIDLAIPLELWCVLLHPHIVIETKAARGILKKEIPLRAHIKQSANLALVLSGLFTADFALIKRGLKDVVIEPQRAHLIPGFYEIQSSAMNGGALGCTISGAGPSIFAWVEGQHQALEVQKQMNAAAHEHGASTSWAFQLKNDGARLLT